MATSVKNFPLIVIVGPTASGKTALSIRLSREFGGEIISADSRAVYRGLDVGTAKPTHEEREGVPHWGFDLVNPGERFTVADFRDYAIAKIEEIRTRGRIPMLVGGTGLYVNAIIYDYQFPPERANERDEYAYWTVEQLVNYCTNNNISLPLNVKNKRHLINAIIRKGQIPKSGLKPIANTIVVGISTDRDVLRKRITARAEVIFDSDIYNEAIQAARKYGWDIEAMTGNVYPLIRAIDAGEMTKEQAKERSITLDMQLAKRQMTWFRRDRYIRWLELEDAYTYIAHRIAHKNKS